MRALNSLIEESASFNVHEKSLEQLEEKLSRSFENANLSINQEFFAFPESSKIVKLISNAFREWLGSVNAIGTEINSLANRLPSYFALALHNEWGLHPNYYSVLKDDLDTPFTQAKERVQAWQRYSNWLQKQIDEPVFFESFSLRQIFVPLRAFYLRKKIENTVSREISPRVDLYKFQDVERVVVNLDEELEYWIADGKREDAIRVVSGGPGSGKSSFAKIFAAKASRENSFPVLFIPLHHFDPTDDLIESIGRFVENEGLISANPLKLEFREKRLLIVFDGLDELAMQGKMAEIVARNFVHEIERKVNQFNHQKLALQVIITGRELSIQSNETVFRREKQILHLLPYFTEENSRSNFIDEKELLAEDQRQVWWKKYGQAKGTNHVRLPEELSRNSLDEITSQPLLNYLVALSFDRGEIDFAESPNLNVIYDDLIKAIYERGWSESQHNSLTGIEERDFLRLLEEIALAAWHGDGRTTTVREIETQCDSALLNKFELELATSPAAGITRLLAAFYFRRSGQRDNQKTFEFTHKSFGEYLISQRIIREIEILDLNLNRRRSNPDDGLNERECLVRWLNLVRSSKVDSYLIEFIENEIHIIQNDNPQLVLSWHNNLTRLISFILANGAPIELISPRKNFDMERLQAQNSNELMFVILSLIAKSSKNFIKLEGQTIMSFGKLLSSFPRQLNEILSSIACQNFWYLELSNTHFIGGYLVGSRFNNVTLNEVSFALANLLSATFQDSILKDVNFSYSFLAQIKFKNALINGSVMLDTKASGGQYENVNFVKVKASEANFKGSKMSNVNFDEVEFNNCDFSGSKFDTVSFTDSNFSGCNFINAKFVDTNFENCNLKGAIFSRDNLDLVNFDIDNVLVVN